MIDRNYVLIWFKEDLDARRWELSSEEVRLAWLYEMMQTESFDSVLEFKQRMEAVFTGVMIRTRTDIKKIKTISNIFHILLYD